MSCTRRTPCRTPATRIGTPTSWMTLCSPLNASMLRPCDGPTDTRARATLSRINIDTDLQAELLSPETDGEVSNAAAEPSL